MKKESQDGHFVSKARCYKSGTKLYAEGDGPEQEHVDHKGKTSKTPGPVVLVAADAGQRFEDHQLEGLDNVGKFFTRVNYTSEK